MCNVRADKMLDLLCGCVVSAASSTEITQMLTQGLNFNLIIGA